MAEYQQMEMPEFNKKKIYTIIGIGLIVIISFMSLKKIDGGEGGVLFRANGGIDTESIRSRLANEPGDRAQAATKQAQQCIFAALFGAQIFDFERSVGAQCHPAAIIQLDQRERTTAGVQSFTIVQGHTFANDSRLLSINLSGDHSTRVGDLSNFISSHARLTKKSREENDEDVFE